MWKLLIGIMAVALAATGEPARAQTAHPAVVSDPVFDRAHPPRSEQVLVPSAGLGMNGLFYLAGGAGPHPTMLLMHGLPGNEKNLDLAHAVRRAGWNVLTFSYRGSWGSPGRFSIAGALADAEAAMAFLRRPDVADRYGIDTSRLVIAGHSMGGLAAAAYARSAEDVAGVILIDAFTPSTAAVKAKANPTGYAASFDDLGNALSGATPEALTAEIIRRGPEWDLWSWAPSLARHPLLLIGAEKGNAKRSQSIAAATGRIGSGVSVVTLPTDHGFSDHRIALASQVVTWLDSLPRPRKVAHNVP